MDPAPIPEATHAAGPSPSAVERRIVSVLFGDLVGFTTLAEGLDPEDLATIQDAYFAAVREVIGRHRGQLEKFIGDAVMAVFGTPRSYDDDALRAVRAGLALVNAVGSLGARLGLETGDLRLRVGVNTGEVLVALDGADAGRVSGDTVNVAARLQAAAPPDGVLVGELTALSIADAIELAAAEPLALKGKAQPVRASLVLALRPQPSREAAMGGLHAPLLGRTGELKHIEEAAARAAGGASVRVLVVAPPGVGKSRLAGEAAERLAADGWRVLTVRVLPTSGPFDAVAELLSAAAGAQTAEGPQTAAGALTPAGAQPAYASPRDVVGALERRLDPADPGRKAVILEDVRALLEPGASPETVPVDRANRFVSWLDALEAAAVGEAPVAWVIEDLHWASEDLLAFLDAAAARPVRRLIVATSRPGILEAGIGGAEDASWDVHHLPTLAPGDCAALVHALVGNALPIGLVDRIVARSDGNCLFVEELLRTWIAVGVLLPTDAGWSLTANPAEMPLPHTVQGIYAAQLDDLPGTARAIARRGAVAGRRFPAQALPSLGIPSPGEGLDILRRRALVGEPRDAELVGPEYAYRHALLRDAGYSSLGRGERAELHVRLARWLETLTGGTPTELATTIGTHYADALDAAPALAAVVGEDLDRAQVADLAAAWLERGADHAQSQSANAAAGEALRRALALTRAANVVDRVRRGRLLGDVLKAIDMDAAAAAHAVATELARVALDAGDGTHDAPAIRHELALAAAGLGFARYEQLRFEEARGVAESALPHLESDLDRIPVEIALLRAREGLTNAYAALADEAAGVVERATATGDVVLGFDAKRLATGFRMNVGLATADDWLLLADEARALGRWGDSAGMQVNAAVLRFEDDHADAVRIVARAEELARQRALHDRLAWIGQVRCEFGLHAGDWDDAIDAARRGLDVATAGNYHRAAVRTWAALTPILDARGDRAFLVEAADWFARWAHIFPGSPYGTVLHLGVDIRLARAGIRDVPEPDPERLAAGLDVVDDSASYLAAEEAIVRWLLDSGRIDEARRAAARYSASTSEQQGLLRRASITLVGAWVCRADGRHDEADRAASEALRNAEAAGAPWWQLRARLAAGSSPSDESVVHLAAGLGIGVDPARRDAR